MMPTNASKMALYGGIVPMTKDDLKRRVEECGSDLDSSLVPTIALKLGFLRGKPQNGCIVDFMPAERPEDKVGLGVLPLLEAIGSTSPCLPEHEDVEEQLCLLLRKIVATNNVNKQRLESLLVPGSFPSSSTGIIRFMWPECQGPVAGGSGNQARSTAGL